ncbi:hypothetical protein OOK60_17320 [Trichothermofontia sichuanensis B231]|uniref:hypothetical protein n=1 Tax=Trichothermofontia sichuanensis TaxID=3045816 RepID=UPI002245077E|nr:hypothetical protein [Trichothermofontia sichuanensis]UZQ54221.1 hypothetical protein OOK60_17320 [Trichothermofontia sichuanensis B231]
MKRGQSSASLFTLPLAVLIGWGLISARVDARTVEISANSPDPVTLSGTAGGQQQSDCGFIPNAPSETLRLTQAFPFLRLQVEGPRSVTLLVDGPGGRFCLLRDQMSNGQLEMSGYWGPGNYNIYIGDTANSQGNYVLSISRRN